MSTVIDGTEQVPSIHESTVEMYRHVRERGIDNVFDRYKAQQPQCSFGIQGICCQLCSHGPCRITPKAPAGICGAGPDMIAARNLLRLAVHGASAYSHHLEETAKTLKATAEGKTPFKIQNEAKLREVADVLGLGDNGSVEELAVGVSNAVISELRKSADEPLALVELFAPESRLKVWRSLGILPGGVHSEVRDALVKTMSNVNSDPVDLLLTALRVGIATGYMGLVATITLQDILFGAPQIVESQADLGVIDPAYVNIVAHGHLPFVGTAVLAALDNEEFNQLAKAAGAAGIRVYGSMCTGQELLQRSGTSAKGFAGQTGNWLNQEFLVATGAVDLMMLDLNCTIPGLKDVAARFHTRLVPVNKMVRLPGIPAGRDYEPETVGQLARELLEEAIEAFKERSGDIHIPPHRARIVAGAGVESILGALGGSLEPLLEAIKSGQIRGIAAVVGCTTCRDVHDRPSVTIAKELIANDVLVISAGCSSSAMATEALMDPATADIAGPGLAAVCKSLGIPPVLNFGSCVDIGRIGVAVSAIAAALGVDPSALPVAASAPEYLEQKAVADGLFAVAFGLLLHLSPAPPVAGAPLVAEILTGEVEKLTGGKVAIETDPIQAAELILKHLEGKRAGLGLTTNLEKEMA
ncbi:MAG: anaerobic carbon-monoxide dehydrogenase catalytic subunit [Actinobacteria bacterium]|nr:anaerobic carbon-monoxide dehydrogenase catalytic subunit [Actinomycetota bacterium]